MSSNGKMSIVKPKILIIGAGITGSLYAYILKKSVPGAAVIVWDKARGSGGRMTTSRTDNGHKVDLGAQYITTDKENLHKYDNEYQSLITKGILKPLSAKVEGMKTYSKEITHFVAPEGMGSLVKHFLSESKATVEFNRLVSSITEENGQHKVVTNDGNVEYCDVLVSTMPIPQVLGIKNFVKNNEILNNLKTVAYSSRFVLILFFDKQANLVETPWATKYLDDEVFRFVSWDNIKRNRNDEPATALLHTTVQYGAININREKSDVEQELLLRVKKLFPDWPIPQSTRCHKWRYSQVQTGYPGAPGCVVVSAKPTLILAGDAFSESNLNGCIASARAAVNATTFN